MLSLQEIRKKLSTMFSDLNFDSRRHLYFVHGENYPSVSSKVHEHEPPFDTEGKLPGSAKKAGVTVKELRDIWQRKNKAACDLGTETHDFLERFSGLETPQTPQQIAGTKFFRHIVQDYDVIFRELRAYSRRFRYAGTMDILLRHKITGKYVIADYKTNADLWKSYEQLYYPFEFLDACPYNLYQLQLSYYQIMLEEIGIKISGRMLVYLQSDEEYKIMELADYSDDLIKHMENKKVQLLW